MKCKKHPRYKAIYQPRANCGGCWAIWYAKRGLVKLMPGPDWNFNG